jgi:ribonuclease HI
MEQSELVNELSASLAKAQLEIKNPAKNATNPFLKNRYADLGSCLNAIRAVAAVNGLAFVQTVEMLGDSVSVSSQISHSSGQWIRQTAKTIVQNGGKNLMQDVGSMSTYLKRYQAQSMWAISGDDDTDAQEITTTGIDERKAAHIDALIVSTNSNKTAFLQLYRITDIKELSEESYSKALKQLQQKKAKQVK